MSTPATHALPRALSRAATALGGCAMALALPAAAQAQPDPAASACGCTAPAPAQALQQATAVFEGSVKQPAPAQAQGAVELAVTRTFRGPDRQVLTVTFTPGDGCGLPTTPGAAYLIYAVGPEDALRTDRCAGSKPIEEAEADLQVLGIGAVPVDPPADANAETTPDEPPARGGCASCTVGRAADGDSGKMTALWALLALIRMRRRNR